VRTLAVDTSTLTGAVALLDGDAAVAECRLSTRVTHSERLLATVDRLLDAAGWRLGDLEALAVGVGPGSFTGLRIGVSTMKSLAFATGLPLAGVPSLDALAWSLPFAGCVLCPIVDARKGEVYAASYRTDQGRIERLSDYRALAPEALAAEFAGGAADPVVFLGDGVGRYAATLERLLGAAARFAPPSHRVPSALAVAELGRAALLAGAASDPTALTPLYVRRAEAELVRERQGAGPRD
jgi:tRNA threonylcarbamoyladenosine biosynthesis protein TsaB